MLIQNLFAVILAIAAVLHFKYHTPLPDLINGTLESCGGLFIYLSVRDLHRAKMVRGVSWKHVAFCSSWGFWNLFYYPNLDQWFSFFGGTFLVALNMTWLIQIAYYLAKEQRSVLS